MNGAILTAEGLTLSIDGVELLHNVHFSVPAGKITCLVGESGSGKSLTMAALLGLLPEGAELAPESRVTFRGQGMFSIYQDHPGGEAAVPDGQRRSEGGAEGV